MVLVLQSVKSYTSTYRRPSSSQHHSDGTYPGSVRSTQWRISIAWRAPMREGTYEYLAAREDAYWWHRARREMAARLLLKYGLPSHLAWLDLGCGTGGNIRLLKIPGLSLSVGLDLSPVGLRLAREKATGAALVNADIARAFPFADSAFDLVTSFNVLYHSWVPEKLQSFRKSAECYAPMGSCLQQNRHFPRSSVKWTWSVWSRRRYTSGIHPTLPPRRAGDIVR